MRGAELMVTRRGAGPVQLRHQVQPQRHLVSAVVALDAKLRSYKVIHCLERNIHDALWAFSRVI